MNWGSNKLCSTYLSFPAENLVNGTLSRIYFVVRRCHFISRSLSFSAIDDVTGTGIALYVVLCSSAWLRCCCIEQSSYGYWLQWRVGETELQPHVNYSTSDEVFVQLSSCLNCEASRIRQAQLSLCHFFRRRQLT